MKTETPREQIRGVSWREDVPMTVAEVWDADQELTISQAKQCLAWIETRAVQAYLNRSRALSEAVRDYMAENFTSTPTTRVEFEEAIRHIADRKYLEAGQ